MAERKTSLPQKPLRKRKRAKEHKPDVVRPESWRYVRIGKSWRRPTGLDHKVRRKIKGWPAGVSVGYKGPKIARGLHPSGYREVLVHNIGELSLVDTKTQAARIGHTVGKRKKIEIIKEAKTRDIYVLNAKIAINPDKEKDESIVDEEQPIEEVEEVIDENMDQLENKTSGDEKDQ